MSENNFRLLFLKIYLALCLALIRRHRGIEMSAWFSQQEIVWHLGPAVPRPSMQRLPFNLVNTFCVEILYKVRIGI